MEQTNKVEVLRLWYLSYIDHFRKEYEKLSHEEKKAMDNTNNYLNPCQIEIFWVTDPDYQLIIQSNFDDRPDREIIVNGPYKLHELHSNASIVLADKRWSRIFEQDVILVDKQIDTLGERMAMKIYNFVEMIKWHIFQPQRSSTNSLGGTAVCDTWTFAHAGNIGDRDHIQEVSKTIQHIRQNAKLKQGTEPIVQQPRSFTEDTYTGYGTYFFPPITIAKGHKPTIEELIHNTPSPWTYGNKAFDMKIGPHQVIVNGDGFVFIETESKEQALQIFNLIMAWGSFYNLRLYAVREHELAKANYDEENLALTEMQWNTGTRRSYLFENRYSPKNMSTTRIMVRPETIREILSNTEKLLAQEELAEDMRLLNEGLTHFANSEYAPSFIMSWSMIERYYLDFWRALLSRKKINGKRLSKLTKSNQWTFDHVLESLNLHDKIDKSSYGALMELKKNRNKFYHKGDHIMQDDAERCLRYAMKLLDEKIKPHVCISNNLVLSDPQNNT